MGTIKNRRRQTKWDKTQADMQGAPDRSDHLLDRVSAIEHAIVRLHGVRCDCGSREAVNEHGRLETYNPPQVSGLKTVYMFGEIRCFYCHRLLEAYGARG